MVCLEEWWNQRGNDPVELQDNGQKQANGIHTIWLHS